MSTESLLGQIIGNRQIEALLGEGGMGAAFLAGIALAGAPP